MLASCEGCWECLASELPKVPKNPIPGPPLVSVQLCETKDMGVQCDETVAVQSGTVAEGEH